MQGRTTLAGRYRLDTKLGSGGMGQVWKAFDHHLRRSVAVKLVHGLGVDDPSKIERLLAEAQVVAQLQHPGIVVVFDVGEHDGQMFLVMELLDGEDLARIMARASGGLPIDVTVLIAERLANALSAAHHKGVIHRDIKPGNIMILPGNHPKLCDFGVARIIRSSGEQVTMGIGTAAYMAPEQFEGRIDGRSDLYALGVVLYEMVTGQRPFLGDSLQLMYQHMRKEPELPSQIRPDVPSVIEDLILELMAKDPEDRPRDAKEVVGRLRAYRRTVQADDVAPVSPQARAKPKPPPPVLHATPASRNEIELAKVLGEFDGKGDLGRLCFALGRDDEGEPALLDLSRSPHVLIGGSVGSPATDPVRGIIATALMRAKPQDLRLALVDSLAGRLAEFSEVPHVIPLPAQGVLTWAADEVSRRYECLRMAKCRTINQFNEHVRIGRVAPPGYALGDEVPHPPVLVVIDELAEHMRTTSGIEQTIAHIAQVGRAVGIHLVIRTTRPTPQVVTSNVKAYVPARLCLSVPSPEKSRCVLDEDGAESLPPGNGLFRFAGNAPTSTLRLACVSDHEIRTLLSKWSRYQ
ncbi:protein kinase [Microbispora rosea]|uniref:protein kinase domain-containing protein n=1 Tax=Microbispora rosea TaxID=58117 RepID=UPI003441BA53